MAQTPVIIEVTPNEWVDLYERAGISLGVRLIVQNVGTDDVFLSTRVDEPELDSKAYQVIQANDFPMVNAENSPGEWARTASANSALSVRRFGQ